MQKKLPIDLKRRFLCTTLICFLTIFFSFGQTTDHTNTSGLTYSWSIDITRPTPETVFNLNNSGAESLLNEGWILYFNSIKKPFIIGADTSMFILKHINGDLFSLTASKLYLPLKTGNSYQINLTVPEIRNYTEVPSGFYIVYDNDLGKGHVIENTTPEYNGIEPAIALSSYKKNKQITAVPEEQLSLIFPSPVKYKRSKGFFNISSKTTIVSSPLFKNEASLLANDLSKILGNKPRVRSKNTSGSIRLLAGKSPQGGYLLSVDTKGITITSSTPEGMFYGIQSLKTMFPVQAWASGKTSIAVASVQVEDAPRFKNRALMLDVARNFQPKEKVFKILNLLALYKLNVLHLHLNDDEGWRLEIPGLPELTDVGAQRAHTLDGKETLPPSYGSGPDKSNPFGSGYYSRKDFIDILIYARKRHIKVIPEIESPGHARAAIKSMDARHLHFMEKGLKAAAEKYLLRDLSDSSIYRSVQGWNDNVINPALPSTYTFIKKVVDEMVKMYAEAAAPLKTIHMGGDEVPDGVWEKSPAVKNLLARDTSINSASGLWKYYFTQVNEIFKKNKLYLSGWEEIGLKKAMINSKNKWVEDYTVINRNYHTDVWNNIIGTGNEDLAYRLANSGFKVMLTNVTNMYFDMAYNKSFYEHGMNWAGFVDVDKAFYFIPFNYYKTTTEDEYGRTVSQDVFKDKQVLKEAAKKNIVGLQSALWTETISKDGILEYLLLPKLLGLAERAWASNPNWGQEIDSVKFEQQYNKAWSAFVSTVGLRELPRLDHYDGGFNYRIPEPGIESSNGFVKANIMFPGFTIRYTTDGSEPNINSTIYSLPVTEKGTITFMVFNKLGRSGKKVVIINK